VRTVLVIGDGVAGTAAAWRAAQGGARVKLVSAGAGASVLGSGAVDDAPWEGLVRAAVTLGTELRARPLGEGVAAFAEALGVWRLPPEGEPMPLLATMAGRLRPARGHDRGLLDLAAIPGGTIAVPRADRAGWDADSLAAAWNDDPFARRRELRFVAIDVALLRFAGEQRIGDVDLAERHDDPARLSWLAARFRDAFAQSRQTPSAVIVGPWLGLDAPRAEALGGLLGLPAGEALASAGSAAGMRLSRAQARLLAAIVPTPIRGRVTQVMPAEDDHDRPSIALLDQTARVRADRIVLACGGLVGGGIVYDPPEIHAGADMPERDAPSFRLSFELGATPDGERPYLASGGARIGVASSMFGPDLDLTAWPTPGRAGVLETVGIACDEEGVAAPYLAVAGDAVADRPRTVLAAVSSGLRAGAWAVR